MSPSFVLCLLFTGFLPSAHAATVIETFEGSSAGSGTPPAGWSFLTPGGGSPAYVTTSSGLGSTGSGGSSGLAGQVTSTAFTNADIAGAYLMHNQVFSMASSLTGTFDFMLVADSTFDDVVFTVGDIANGTGISSAGELLSIKLAEAASTGVAASMSSGLGNTDRLSTSGTLLAQNTWYRGTFTWTPTSGTTGNASFTVNNFTSNLYTLSTTGFTFDTASANIGFGSVNDVLRFDNVNFTGTAVPEPGTTLLMSMCGLLLLFRRQRN